MSRKVIIILGIVLLLLFGFAGMAAAEEGGNETETASSDNSSGQSQDSASDTRSVNNNSSFSETESSGSISSEPDSTTSPETPSISTQPVQTESSFEAGEAVTGEAEDLASAPEGETDPAAPGKEDKNDYSDISDDYPFAAVETVAPEQDNESYVAEEAASEANAEADAEEPGLSNTDSQATGDDATMGTDSGSVSDAVGILTADDSDSQLIDVEEVDLSDPEILAESNGADINLADPYFYYKGIKYSFYYGVGVDDPYNYYNLGGNAIQKAIDFIAADNGVTASDGMIYVESYHLPYNGFTIDGSLPYLNTIKGVAFQDFYHKEAAADFDPYDSTNWPNISGNVTIANMKTFTLLGFLVGGSINFDNCNGQLNLNYLEVSGAGNGIYINNHSGNVVVSDVDASSNAIYGAFINNSKGGNITISNSAFDKNRRSGLLLTTNGTVTIDGISASGNGTDADPNMAGYGMSVEGFSKLNISNAVFNFNNLGGTVLNTGMGLWAESTKDAGITLKNTYARGNRDHGLKLITDGLVSLSDINSIENERAGLVINNSSATKAKNVNVIHSYLNLNGWEGAFIYSKGSVTLADVSAVSNSQAAAGSFDGLYIDNTFGSGCVTLKTSKTTDYQNYSDNGAYGIYIRSSGNVSVSNVSTNDNTTYSGLFVDNLSASSPRTVSINRSFAENNGRAGLYIRSKGAVTLTDVSAIGNGLTGSYNGADIDNTAGSAGVTIKSSKSGTTYEFSQNTGHGIHILSNGAVSVSDVNALFNIQRGITIINETALKGQKVSLTRGTLNNNGRQGTYITSRGLVTLSDVSATGNGLAGNYGGAEINNRFGTGSAGVTIKSSKAGTKYEFSHNKSIGIAISTNGAVAVSDISACGNTWQGVVVHNETALKAKNVSITRGNFIDNDRHGLYIHSIGAVILTDVNAEDNGNSINPDGVYIDNMFGTGNVTVKSSKTADYYSYSGNHGAGININSLGTITISNIRADNNSIGNGIKINNINAAATRAVYITRSSSSQNGQHGLFVLSSGAVTLTDVSANDNGTAPGSYSGLYISNTSGSAGVTIKSSKNGTHYSFSNNTKNGIEVLTKGSVKISDIVANGNNDKGVEIDNQGATKVQAVSLSRGVFAGNGYEGLTIDSLGSVTMIDVSAFDNGHSGDRSGVIIDNYQSGAGSGSVTIKSSKAGSYNDFINNAGYGLTIASDGTISISNVNAADNTLMGISARTYASQKNITLNKVKASGNVSHGISLQVNDGTINVKNVSSFKNFNHGIHIGIGSGKVNFDNCAFIGNNSSGIHAERTLNLLSLKKTFYYGNDTNNSGSPNIYYIH